MASMNLLVQYKTTVTLLFLRWRQETSPKCQYLSTKLHDVTSQKTTNLNTDCSENLKCQTQNTKLNIRGGELLNVQQQELSHFGHETYYRQSLFITATLFMPFITFQILKHFKWLFHIITLYCVLQEWIARIHNI